MSIGRRITWMSSPWNEPVDTALSVTDQGTPAMRLSVFRAGRVIFLAYSLSFFFFCCWRGVCFIFLYTCGPSANGSFFRVRLCGSARHFSHVKPTQFARSCCSVNCVRNVAFDRFMVWNAARYPCSNYLLVFSSFRLDC